MRRAGRAQDIAPRTVTRVNEPAIAQFLPGGEIEWPALALPNRFPLPFQSEPAQIFLDRVPKSRTAPRAIQVFDAQEENAARRPCTFLCTPKSDGVTDVQITSGRRREPAAIRRARVQTGDFRLPHALFNSKSPLLNSALSKRLLLFDIDGTLINSGGAGVAALRDVLREDFGIGDDLHGIEIAGRTDSGIVHQILRKIGLQPDESNTARFLERYVELLARELPRSRGRVLPGIEELLRRLQGRPEIVLALLTGNVERGARLKLEHYGIWHFFEFGAFADDHHDRNELGAFARQRAQEKHGIEFESAAIDVIGDTPHDIACGKAIGARTIAVATGSFSREELARHEPDWLVDDFAAPEEVIARLGW
jgi:phosphoglycolate phosphatase